MKQGGANHKLHLQLQHKRMLLDPISDALKRHKVGSSAGSSGIGQMGPGSSYGGGGSSVLGATSSRVLAFDGSSCEWFFTGAGADNNRVSAGGNSSRQPLPRGSSNADAGGLQANPQQEQQQQNGPGDSAEQVEPFRILSDDEVEDMDFDLTPKWDTVSGMYCFHNLPEYVIDEFAGVDIDFVLGLQDEQGDDGGSQQQQQQQGVTVFEYDDSKLTKGDIVTRKSCLGLDGVWCVPQCSTNLPALLWCLKAASAGPGCVALHAAGDCAACAQSIRCMHALNQCTACMRSINVLR